MGDVAEYRGGIMWRRMDVYAEQGHRNAGCKTYVEVGSKKKLRRNLEVCTTKL
jgi:hypothetical protein